MIPLIHVPNPYLCRWKFDEIRRSEINLIARLIQPGASYRHMPTMIREALPLKSTDDTAQSGASFRAGLAPS